MIYLPSTIDYDIYVDFRGGHINMWLHTPLHIAMFVTFMAGAE